MKRLCFQREERAVPVEQSPSGVGGISWHGGRMKRLHLTGNLSTIHLMHHKGAPSGASDIKVVERVSPPVGTAVVEINAVVVPLHVQ